MLSENVLMKLQVGKLNRVISAYKRLMEQSQSDILKFIPSFRYNDKTWRWVWMRMIESVQEKGDPQN